MIVLVGALVTAYWLGRWHGTAQTDEANQAEVAAMQKARARVAAAKLAEAKRPKTALELASIKNEPPDTMRQMTSHKLGNVTLSEDQMGNFYIDDTDLGLLMMDGGWETALALIAKLPKGDLTSQVYRTVYLSMAGGNPANGPKAAALAAALPPGPDRTSALIGVVDGWVGSMNSHEGGVPDDVNIPKEMLDWASGLSAADSSVFKEALISVSQKDPALAAQYVGNLQDASARDAAILTIAQNWGNGYWANRGIQDPAATLDWLNQVATGTTYDKATQAIFSNFNSKDPALGATLVDKLTDPIDRNAAITQLSKTWGGQDPAAALNWLQSLPAADSVASNASITSLVSTWANKDFAAATAYVNTADPAVFNAVAPVLAPAMAKTDPQAALNWVNQFPDSAMKAQAISGVLATVAATDFTSAWGYATSMPAGTGRDGAMDSLVSTLSATDPAQAATYLGQLGSGAAAVSATNSLAANWASKDPAGLTTWINAQPAGDVRDAAVVQFVKVQSAKDPAAAVALANTITDQPTRATQVKTAVLALAKTDVNAATNAAQSADLNDAQRQKLLILLSQGAAK
jgi:hypothetical protein